MVRFLLQKSDTITLKHKILFADFQRSGFSSLSLLIVSTNLLLVLVGNVRD